MHLLERLSKNPPIASDKKPPVGRHSILIYRFLMISETPSHGKNNRELVLNKSRPSKSEATEFMPQLSDYQSKN